MSTLLNYLLTKNFEYFFYRLNPASTFEEDAAREYGAVSKLLKSSVLQPECFLQGSYKQDTAIHCINDIDIIALCGGGIHCPSNSSSSTKFLYSFL